MAGTRLLATETTPSPPALIKSNAIFLLSTWLKNKYRTNEYVFTLWKEFYIATKEHFYHIGGKEINRNSIYEAILSNIKLKDSVQVSEILNILDNKKIYPSKKIKKRAEQLFLAFD